jgi:hypothetical protein
MSGELVSKKTRNEFREFLVGWKLREIEMEFDGAHVGCDHQYDPPVSGQRRSLVEQHYHTLDFTSPADVLRLLAAYENILNTATRNVPTQYDKAAAERAIEGLVACLKKDGFKYRDGKITPITPVALKVFDEASSADRSISEITRRNILDAIRLGDVAWSGRLSEPDFLSRLYDLDSLPSHDHRFTTAKEDIWQHRESNPDDWREDWVLTDSRLDLMHGPDEAFLRFLCEMIHPVVRADTQDVESLVRIFNQHLGADGWEIVARTRISGKPVFAARRRVLEGSPSLGAVKPFIDVLNAEYVTQQITRMEASIVSDPELAIGTAKEFVETICKTVLRECEQTVSASADLPQLVKQVREILDLLPHDIPEKARGAETIKRVLSNLGTVAQGLAELRGLYGSGHGKHAKAKGLQPRHARLAVGAACTLALFLFETYQDRKGNKQ